MRTRRRAGQPVAALDAVPADARRIARLERRSHGDGAVRAIAAPQVRLTKDPNTFFFFLDHLAQRIAVPARRRHDLGHQHRARHLLGDAADREGQGDPRQVAERQGVRAGLGRPGMERRGGAIAEARPQPTTSRSGSSASGRRSAASFPSRSAGPNDTTPPRAADALVARPLVAVEIAAAGGGEYLELDREGDREIANRIIDATRRRAGSRGLEVTNEELYWRCLARGRSLPRRRLAVHAGAHRALAAGGRRGGGARLRVDAD